MARGEKLDGQDVCVCVREREREREREISSKLTVITGGSFGAKRATF